MQHPQENIANDFLEISAKQGNQRSSFSDFSNYHSNVNGFYPPPVINVDLNYYNPSLYDYPVGYDIDFESRRRLYSSSSNQNDYHHEEYETFDNSNHNNEAEADADAVLDDYTLEALKDHNFTSDENPRSGGVDSLGSPSKSRLKWTTEMVKL
jgi:hypothetical protein